MSMVPVALDTVMATDADVVVLPETSRATAVNVWAPFEAVVVFQTTEYGATVSSDPMFTPSALNWIPAIPRVLWAPADTVTAAPETVEPEVGDVIVTVG